MAKTLWVAGAALALFLVWMMASEAARASAPDDDMAQPQWVWDASAPTPYPTSTPALPPEPTPFPALPPAPTPSPIPASLEPTPEPTTQPVVKPAPKCWEIDTPKVVLYQTPEGFLGVSLNCDHSDLSQKLTCDDFDTWGEAQLFYLISTTFGGGSDPHWLVARDSDGIACKELPGAPRIYDELKALNASVSQLLRDIAILNFDNERRNCRDSGGDWMRNDDGAWVCED